MDNSHKAPQNTATEELHSIIKLGYKISWFCYKSSYLSASKQCDIGNQINSTMMKFLISLTVLLRKRKANHASRVDYESFYRRQCGIFECLYVETYTNAFLGSLQLERQLQKWNSKNVWVFHESSKCPLRKANNVHLALRSSKHVPTSKRNSNMQLRQIIIHPVMIKTQCTSNLYDLCQI